MNVAQDSKLTTYNWSPQRYIELVEQTDDLMLRGYQKAELDYVVSKVQSSKNKTFIDVGAGYGRILPHLSTIAREIIAVEIDPEMLGELKRRSEGVTNVRIVEGNGNHLTKLLKNNDTKNPVVLSLQNSLGTWKGSYKQAIEEMKRVAQQSGGEIIISLFCQEGLKDAGIDMYTRIQELVGEPDLEMTDFEKGIFRSKIGYRSKWWTREERREIREMLDGKVIGNVETKNYSIIHVKFE